MTFAEAQRSVLEACRLLSARGYLAGVGGNVALRVDRWHFAVTPSAFDYGAMEPEDVAVLTLSDRDLVAGRRRPSVESALHARVFLSRADVQASVHTHQPIASALALLDCAVPVEDPALASRLGPRIARVAYAPSGTPLLVRALARRLEPGVHAYLLRNHGVLAVGTTMDQAIERVGLVEQVAARFLEAALPPPTDSAVERLVRATLHDSLEVMS